MAGRHRVAHRREGDRENSRAVDGRRHVIPTEGSKLGDSMKIGLSITILLCTYASAARSLPISPVLVLKQGFDTASLARETDTPQHPLGLAMTAVTVDGETAETLHVSVADLVDHDVLRSPEFAVAPTITDEAKTVLWARGDVHTPTLMFEWDERDGTRWIATFPVTDQWRRVVLSPKDFHPWMVDADRARLGFHPAQVVRFRMGLDTSNTHTVPGPHEYWVAQVGIETSATAPVPILPALTIPLRPADTNVTCQVGDHLQLTGSVTMQKTFDSCLLVADGAVAETRTPSIPTDAYAFTWTPQTPGTHTLELRYANLHAKVTVRRLLVTAAASPPAVFSGLPATAGADTAVSVVGSGPTPFPLARVDFYFNGKPLAVATTPPFAATLPVEAITQPGTYPVTFIAYDTAGRPFYAHAATVEVPQRVQVTAPRVFTLRHAGDRASLTASVLPGIKVAKVSYSIVHADASHYEVMADVTAAPFSADVDLSRYASGDYWVRAIATSAAGNSYEAWAVQLTLTNTPDDDRKAQEAKAKAAEDARLAAVAAEGAKRQAAVDHVQSERAANLAVFAPRDGYDERIFRDQLTRLAFYAPELRQGKVGSVHALAVLTVGGEAVTGVPFTVSALVRPGNGQVNFLANAEDDAKIAVQQAAEFCKMRTAPQGWDWSRYDLTVGYDQNDIKSGGPSAGLADAIAILSCSFKLPVDDSVAMTGAVTLQGRVQPVGGVDFKAEAAFRDPFIHTLIVPDGEVSAESLIRLYISQPALCFSRRVVMVHTVDEAAKEAIIGWSHSDYLHEENLVQGGLRHFARGEDALAVAAFKVAHDTDPDNWTPTFWIAMLDLMRQQRQKDAAQATSDANLGIKGK